MIATNYYIKSPINYIGNKYKLLPQIVPLLPSDIHTFVDLFGGSGTVLLNVKANKYIYNDINSYVADILHGIKQTKPSNILNNINTLISTYGLTKTNEQGFLDLRTDYNNGKNYWEVLYTLMCYSFNYQFRFNNNHQYNSSFGKNRSCFSEVQRKSLSKVSEILSDMDIEFERGSFEDFDTGKLTKDDFVYLDPPYTGSVGNYNDGKRGFEGWTYEHESKLRELLVRLNSMGIRFALSNNIGVNDTLEGFALDNGLKIHRLECSYKNSSYQKKDGKEDIEVLITNY